MDIVDVKQIELYTTTLRQLGCVLCDSNYNDTVVDSFQSMTLLYSFHCFFVL